MVGFLEGFDAIYGNEDGILWKVSEFQKCFAKFKINLKM
jgi:hypothetical protein